LVPLAEVAVSSEVPRSGANAPYRSGPTKMWLKSKKTRSVRPCGAGARGSVELNLCGVLTRTHVFDRPETILQHSNGDHEIVAAAIQIQSHHPPRGRPVAMPASKKHQRCEKRSPISALIYVLIQSPRRRGRVPLARMVIPSALAVWRLMTNSYFVGCSTARSAGCAPFRILSTYTADRPTNSAKIDTVGQQCASFSKLTDAGDHW